MCDVGRVKSIRLEWDINREPLFFVLYRHIGSLVVHVIRSEPLASFGDTLLDGQSFTECQLCAETLIALRGT
jgi:hypothetical protein